jgi:hypothetical protein
VFNDDDLRDMTEMSPKNKSGLINFASYGFEYNMIEA